MFSEKKCLQLTSQLAKEEEYYHFPISDKPNIKSNSVCYALINSNANSTAHMDMMGRFHKKSSRG